MITKVSKPRTLFQTLSFKGLALLIFSVTAFPYVAKPVENILIDFFPKNRVLIVNGSLIVGGLLATFGTGMNLKGRIDIGDVETPKYIYGPDSLPVPEPQAVAVPPEQSDSIAN
jgi:hypothetical protein